jgi:hypothetical protein
MAIIRVSDPTFEGKRSDNRIFVRFRVNRSPDQTWINTFKGHASSSVLRAANAVFNGSDVTLELVRPKSRAELTTALDCFIECAKPRVGSGLGPRPRLSRVQAAGSARDRMTRPCRVTDGGRHRSRHIGDF